MATYGTYKTLAGPAYISSSAANILAAPSSGIIYNAGQLTIANATATSATYKIYLGATGGSAGGTEVATGTCGPLSTVVHYFSPPLHMQSTQFLSGIASVASTLTITVTGASLTSDPS